MRHRTNALRARRVLRALAGVLFAASLLFAGCKSAQDRKKEHAKCMSGCVTQHLPGGPGNEIGRASCRERV